MDPLAEGDTARHFEGKFVKIDIVVAAVVEDDYEILTTG
jgi:hypothetical protein